MIGIGGSPTIWRAGLSDSREDRGVVSYREAARVGGVMVAQLTTRSDATSGFHYLYRDGLGSTVALTDQAGHPVQAFAYGPYGRRRAAGGWSSVLTPGQGPHINPPTRRGYTGGEQFDALGAVVLGARVYIPALGRWLSPDPAGVGSPYVYASDNPESATDPTGEFSLMSGLKLVAMAAAVYYTGGAILAGGGGRRCLRAP